MNLFTDFEARIKIALEDIDIIREKRSELDFRRVTVEPPRDPSHGDLATNAAMVLAKAVGTNPRALAEGIKPKLEALPPVASVEIAGPGFINRRLMPDAWRDDLETILREG